MKSTIKIILFARKNVKDVYYLNKILDHSIYKINFIRLDIIFSEKKFYRKYIIITRIMFNIIHFLILIPLLILKRANYHIIHSFTIAVSYCIIFKLFPLIKPRKKTIITYFYLHELGKLKLIKKAVSFILNDKRLHLVVQSKGESEYYKSLGINPKNIHFQPYCQNPVRKDPTKGIHKEYIFSGGKTNRDYEILLEVAKDIDYEFIIICSKHNTLPKDIPDNVTILKDESTTSFNGYLSNSKIVIIPLKQDVGSSGQMLTLAAMSEKKPIIFTHMPCISDYLKHENTGLSFPPKDKVTLKKHILELIKDEEKCKYLANNAYDEYNQKFRKEKYFITIKNIMENN